MKYRISFKSHRASVREFHVETDGVDAAHYVEAALRANYWIVTRREKTDDS